MKYSKTFIKIRDILAKICIKLGIDRIICKIYTLTINRSYHKKFYKEMEERKNGKVDKRYIKLKDVKNIHAGERCFIVCTGPSLTFDDLNKLNESGEYTFGLNTIFKIFDKTNWRPDYYVVFDNQVYNEIRDIPEFKAIENKFLSDYFFLDGSFPDDCYVFPNENYENAVHDVRRFSDDIYIAVHMGYTVVFSAMQIAAYMGFKEIYLIGCDADYTNKNGSHHVAGTEYKNEKKVVVRKELYSRVMQTYETAKQYCDKHGIKIYNATRGGKLEVFPRMDFDSLFNEKSDYDKASD